MKSNLRKLGLILMCIFIVGSISACKTSSSPVLSEDTVIATIDGKNITRADLGSELEDAEKEIIENYIYEQLSKEFFSDVEVTDTEVETQLSIMKAQIGEEQWPIYLMMYGGGNEDSFKVMVKEALQQEKKIEEKGKEIEISDEDIETSYNEAPNSYNIVVMDVLFLNTEANLQKALALYNDNKTLEEISDELDIEISTDEHAYFESELIWNKEISTTKIGDMVITTEDSGNYIIGRIKELHIGWKDEKVKEDMLDMLRYEKGLEVLDGEFSEFLKSKKATILGKDFPLYEEIDRTDDTELFGGNEEDLILSNEVLGE